MQAQTAAQRMNEASEMWKELDDLISAHHVPERMTGMLYEALLGYRIRRPGYMKMTGVEKHTPPPETPGCESDWWCPAAGEGALLVGRHGASAIVVLVDRAPGRPTARRRGPAVVRGLSARLRQPR